MTIHCTSPSASSKCAVIAGSATLTAMSSGASDAPSPTITRPSAAGGAPLQWRVFLDVMIARLESRAPSGSEVGAQEGHHALPCLLGAGGIVGRALLVGEGVRRVVAVDLRLVAGVGHRLLEAVDHLRRAPVVLVGEVTLDRNPDLCRISQLA